MFEKEAHKAQRIMRVQNLETEYIYILLLFVLGVYLKKMLLHLYSALTSINFTRSSDWAETQVTRVVQQQLLL